MPRIRTIKPETAEDEKLGQVSRDARLMFILLWTICDDHGRFRSAPVHLRSRLFGYDDVALAEVAEWLGELAGIGRVGLYEVDGERYGVVSNWGKHQRIDNASKPLYPDPPESFEPPPESPRATTTDGDSPQPTEVLGEPPRAAESLGESRQDSASLSEPPLDLDLDLERDLDLEGEGEGSPREGGSVAPPAAARLCDLLADCIGQRSAKRPKVTQAWLADMDRLLRLDHRDPADVEHVIRWLHEAPDDIAQFWRPNVRSPSTLRAKWDQMSEQVKARRQRRGTQAAWEGSRQLVAVTDPDVNPLDAIYGRPASA